MTHEVYRGELSNVAKIYTIAGYLKVCQTDKKLGTQEVLYVNKKVVRTGVQARSDTQQENYTYVIESVDNRANLEYLAFLINSSPWKVMLGDGNKFLEGINTPTTIGALKKLPVVLLTKEEQSACAFLNTLITMICDGLEKEDEDYDDLKKAHRSFSGIRDYIAMEILLDGMLSCPDISVLSAWTEEKSIYDSTQDKMEATISLLKSIFSSNNVLRDRMNKMRLYIDEKSDAIFNKFPK